MNQEYRQNVYNITKEMLRDRKYNNIELLNDNSDTLVAKNIIGKKIMVIFDFVEGSKIKKGVLTSCINMMEEESCNHIILVYNDTATSDAKKYIETLAGREKIVEIFTLDQLSYNPLKFFMQPSYEKLTNPEKISLYEYVGKNIPGILKSDPVCRWYNFQIKDVIKITRKSGEVIYRVVKKG